MYIYIYLYIHIYICYIPKHSNHRMKLMKHVRVLGCFTAKQKADSHPKFLEERTTKVTLLTTQDSRLFQVPSAGIVAG